MINLFWKRGNDAIQVTPTYSLKVLVGPMIRSRSKRFKETFNGLLQDAYAKVGFQTLQKDWNKNIQIY